MARPGKGEKGYTQANDRWRATMEKKYGGKEGLHRQMQRMGSLGGRAGCTGGFFGDSELARYAGAKGGAISRRGYKLIARTEEGDYVYQNKRDNSRLVVSKLEAENIQKKILLWIMERGTVTASSDTNLAAQMKTDFASAEISLSVTIGKMVRNGWIKKESPSVKGSRYYSATEEGERIAGV